jgi:hypothetical protein
VVGTPRRHSVRRCSDTQAEDDDRQQRQPGADALVPRGPDPGGEEEDGADHPADERHQQGHELESLAVDLLEAATRDRYYELQPGVLGARNADDLLYTKHSELLGVTDDDGLVPAREGGHTTQDRLLPRIRASVLDALRLFCRVRVFG